MKRAAGGKKKIFDYLFKNHQATISELSEYTSINKNTIRDYLKQFVADDIIDRLSDKQRDKNALFVFRKR